MGRLVSTWRANYGAGPMHAMEFCVDVEVDPPEDLVTLAEGGDRDALKQVVAHYRHAAYVEADRISRAAKDRVCALYEGEGRV